MNPYGSSRTFLGSVWGMILGLKYGLVPSQTVAMDLSPPHPRSPAVLCGAAVRGGRGPAASRSIRIVEERQTNTVLSFICKYSVYIGYVVCIYLNIYIYHLFIVYQFHLFKYCLPLKHECFNQLTEYFKYLGAKERATEMWLIHAHYYKLS